MILYWQHRLVEQAIRRRRTSSKGVSSKSGRMALSVFHIAGELGKHPFPQNSNQNMARTMSKELWDILFFNIE